MTDPLRSKSVTPHRVRSRRSWSRSVIAVALVVTSLGAAASTPGGSPASAQTAPQNSFGAGGEYHPLTPARIYDTRDGGINDTEPLGKKPTSAQGSEFHVDVLGQGGVPDTADDVLAVVLNVVVADPEGKGNLALYPKGFDASGADGISSLINFFPGRNVPNLAIVGVGDDGAITVKLTTPSGPAAADVAIDVFGWISTSSAADRGARFVPAGPARLLDTREAGGALGPRESVRLQIRGADAVSPALVDVVPDGDTVTGVMVNITAVNRQSGSRNTFVSATPTAVPAGEVPSTSNTNVVPGLVKASLAIVPVGPDGAIHLYNHQGELHLAVDVLGYLQTGADVATREGRVVPLEAPFRVLDTRETLFGNTPLATGSAEDWSFKDFAESVTLGGVPIGEQSAMIGNLTGTDLQRIYSWVPVTTYLQMYPGDVQRPITSNINVPEGENVPNLSLMRYGSVEREGVMDDYVVQAYNHAGSLHYLLDVYAVVLAD